MSPGKKLAPRPAKEAYGLDVDALRRDFPILASEVHGKPLVYLDNAASTQKPRAVLEAMQRFYEHDYSNVHRGVHELSARATQAFEDARTTLGTFIGARDRHEIVFTSGTTGGINLVAHCFGAGRVGPGDEILITQMEHHSNIVPWKQLAERNGARLRVVPIDDAGDLVLDEYERSLGPRTRLVSVTHTSNALGTCNPLPRIIATAHAAGVPVLVDAAQAVAHRKLDVAALDCDFLAFSGHKMFGPTGIGVLGAKAEWLEAMPPFLGGGEMIRSVSFDTITYREPPYRFEAGTPDIAGTVGLAAAARYLDGIGLARIERYDRELLDYMTARVSGIAGLRPVGTARHKSSILSFVLAGIHPHDAATALDLDGVAVRAGHHCAQPVMERFGVAATLRASLACYNTREEIDTLVAAIERAIEVLS